MGIAAHRLTTRLMLSHFSVPFDKNYHKGSFKKYVTLGGGGGFDEVSHILFIIFKILFLMFLEEKLVVTKQDTASKDTFFLIKVEKSSVTVIKLVNIA